MFNLKKNTSPLRYWLFIIKTQKGNEVKLFSVHTMKAFW